MSRRVPDSTWAEIRTAYAAGVGLRETARNLGVPAGTVLSRAKREGWTQQIAQAKAKAKAPEALQSNAITVTQSAAISMAERGQRHVERMAGVAEKVVPHVEAMAPGDILDRIEKIERLDKVARRTFGIGDDTPRTALMNLNLLSFPPELLAGLPKAPVELELPE